MRIFVSSVREGLEKERDSLPGLIKALGHEPVRFEDFSAQPVPSRQACIDAVESSDAYLLLLGPHYGATFLETGQSATHDEWIAAQRIGLPRFVFRKEGDLLDPRQAKFERDLGEYGTGRFYKKFHDATDLQAAVALVIRELESNPGVLEFEPLTHALSIRWLSGEASNRRHSTPDAPQLEIHMVPLDGKPVSARLLGKVLAGLPDQVRSIGLVSPVEALEVEQTDSGIKLKAGAPRRGGWHDVYGGSLEAVAVHPDGQATVTFRLPGDNMGSLLDIQDVTKRVAAALRLLGLIDATGAPHIAIGVGIPANASVAVGSVGPTPRNTAQLSISTSPVRVEPDEMVSRAALDRGADEVAASLAKGLLRAFESRSRY